MPRPTLTELIQYVRLLAGLTTAEASDDNIQAALDRHRVREIIALTPTPEPAPGGAYLYYEFCAPVGYWERNAVLLTPKFEPIPSSDLAEADYVAGRFRFLTSRPEGVYISGVHYDPYLAGAELLEALAARYKADFDISGDGTTLARSQKVRQILALAAELRRRSGAFTAKVIRDDF